MQHDPVGLVGTPLSGFDPATLPNDQRRRLLAGLAFLEELRAEMIAELDRLEGDSDFEDDGDGGCEIDDSSWHGGERSLGWSEGESLCGRLGVGSDDGEPSLGSSSAIDQRGWSTGRAVGRRDQDLEDEHDGCEEEIDQNTGDDEEDDHGCPWQDEGDQTKLRQVPITPSRQPATARSPHQNIGPFMPVRVL